MRSVGGGGGSWVCSVRGRGVGGVGKGSWAGSVKVLTGRTSLVQKCRVHRLSTHVICCRGTLVVLARPASDSLLVLQGSHRRAVQHFLCAETQLLRTSEPGTENPDKQQLLRDTWNGLGLSYIRSGEPEQVGHVERTELHPVWGTRTGETRRTD